MAKHSPQASLEEIKQAWRELNESPVTLADGRTFDYDRFSRDMMDRAIRYLKKYPGLAVPWRMSDHSTVEVTGVTLEALREEIEDRAAERALGLDAAYLAMKEHGASKRAAEAFKKGGNPHQP